MFGCYIVLQLDYLICQIVETKGHWKFFLLNIENEFGFGFSLKKLEIIIFMKIFRNGMF